MSRQEEQKRSVELSIFRMLQEADETLPPGEPFVLDKPDVRLPTSRGLVGIEVTRLFFGRSRSGRPAQEQDALKIQFAELAKEFFALTGMPEAVARPVFRSNAVFDKRRLRSDALAFANAVAMASIQSTKSRRFTSSEVPDLPELVSAFYGRLCYPGEKARWVNGIAGLVHLVTPAHIESTIAEKEAKLGDYDQSLAEYWLVIALHGWTSAALAEVSPAVSEHRFLTRFSRVYFFDTFSRQSVRLNVAHIEDTA